MSVLHLSAQPVAHESTQLLFAGRRVFFFLYFTNTFARSRVLRLPLQTNMHVGNSVFPSNYLGFYSAPSRSTKQLCSTQGHGTLEQHSRGWAGHVLPVLLQWSMCSFHPPQPEHCKIPPKNHSLCKHTAGWFITDVRYGDLGVWSKGLHLGGCDKGGAPFLCPLPQPGT